MTAANPDDGEVALSVGGQTISGWDEVTVTRGVETCPSSFNISLTEIYPGEAAQVQVKAGDPFALTIGGDLVVTGYVDILVPSYAAKTHRVRLIGRGKCQDLVDCSAEWPGGQIKGANALQVAQKLAQPYGITVKSLADPGPAIPQFNLTLTDTAYQIIEEICRFAGLLAYEDEQGQLVLAQAGTTTAASGFSEGKNVLAASVTYAMNQRYSEVEAFLRSMETLGDLGNAGNLLDRETDPVVPRHRRKSIIAEAPVGGQDIAKKRAKWEIARRAGRSAIAQISADSWRDSAGKLWTPNTLAPISLPGLKLDGVTWCIGAVTYRRGAQGSWAELELMDPKAFLPEPILLVPVVPGLR